MIYRIIPQSLQGEITAPPSKSDAHRALIAAALADKPTRILLPSLCDDTERTLACLSALGAAFEREGNILLVRPITAANEAPYLDAGESGSTLRFLLPIAAALGAKASFTGCGRLPERPLSALTSALSEHGIRFDGEHLPFSISGKLTGGRFTLPGNLSSQFISGLLFALPLLSTDVEICIEGSIESKGYLDLTCQVLHSFGVDWAFEENTYRLLPHSRYTSPSFYTVEGDYSSASFFLVAAALGANVSVRGLNPDSLQADAAILPALKQAGIHLKNENQVLSVSSGKPKPFSFDVSSCPDVFPILAILALGAEGTSRLFGARRLRYKESDRIASTAALIRTLGGNAVEEEDALTICGNSTLLGGNANGANDHRIVMAAAVASLLCKEPLTVTDAEQVKKSYPSFWEEWKALGGNVDEIQLR